MNKFRKKARKREEEKLSEAVSSAIARWLHAPKLPAELKLDDTIAIDGYGLNYRLNFPANFSLASHNKKCMLDAGWECEKDNFEKEHLNEWAYGAMIFKRPGNKNTVRVTFHYNLWKRGSTCKQVKIGSKIVENEKGVYEIVCEEGDAEGVFAQ